MSARANRTAAGVLVDALAGCGLTDAVVSPGSRNTPMVLALEAARPQVRVTTVIDERQAAFVALGMARASGRATLLSCTSGSAGAHWLPAFVEASEAGVPVIGVTADRPAELHGCGAGQTTAQRAFFGEHVRLFRDLAAPHDGLDPRWLATVAAQAWDAASGADPGPVHLNAAFREPLWAPQKREGRRDDRAPRVVRGTPAVDDATLGWLARRLAAAERGAIVVGPLPEATRAAREAIHGLAAILGWPLLADSTSNLRFGGRCEQLITTHDALLADPDFAEVARCDAILRFGAAPTARATYEWLARQTGAEVVLVDPHGRWQDPGHVADHLLVSDAGALCHGLVGRLGHGAAPTRWLDWWRAAEARAAEAFDAGAGLHGGAAAAAVAAGLPDGAILHVASSMAVRDLDAFARPRGPRLRVLANRGVNGIDGLVATAAGEALACPDRPVCLLTGDVALLHDLSALPTAARLAPNLTIVLLDNRGGGIFDRLPIAAHPNGTLFTERFVTEPHVDFEAFTRAAGLSWRVAESAGDLRAWLREPPGGVIAVRYDRSADLAAHRDSQAAVSEAVRGLVAEGVR